MDNEKYILISKSKKYKRIFVLGYYESVDGGITYFWRELKGLFEDIERDFELGLNGRYGLVAWDGVYEEEFEMSLMECKYKIKVFSREDKSEFCNLECMNKEYENEDYGNKEYKDYSECWCKSGSVKDFVEMLRESLGEGLYENGEIWIKDELGNVVMVGLDGIVEIGWVRIE